MALSECHSVATIHEGMVSNEASPYLCIKENINKAKVNSELRKIQESIIRRFLRGEISKSEAHKLDSKLFTNKHFSNNS